MNKHQLNDAYDTIAAHSEWGPSLIDLLAELIAELDPDVVIDTVETLGDPIHAGMSPTATTLYLSQLVPPDEVMATVLSSERYIEVIRLPDLSDVIQVASYWDSDWLERLEYWMAANASRGRAAAMARVAGHPELADDPRLDAADIALALTDHITPGAMRYAWGFPQLRSRHLNDGERESLRKLRGRRRSGRRAYRAPNSVLIERLRMERRSGIAVAELAETVGLSAARIYQLTR